MSPSIAGEIQSPPVRRRTFAAPDQVSAAALNGAAVAMTWLCALPNRRSVAARSVGSISGFWHGAPQRVIEIDVLNSAGPIFERIAIRLTRLLCGAHRPVALDVAEL